MVMKLIESLKRFMRFIRRNGIFSAVKRAAIHIWRDVFQNGAVVFYANGESDEKITKVNKVDSVEFFDKNNVIPEETLKHYLKIRSLYQTETYLEKQLKKRFENGSRLWVLRSEENIVAVGWTCFSPNMSFYLPLAHNDLIIYDIETDRNFRGGGYAGILLDEIMKRMGKGNVIRFYIAAKTWNKSSIRAIEKTSFIKIAKVYKFSFFGKQISIVW